MTETPATEPQEKVGFRDIYRAVGESEARIKEHISLALIPFATQLNDHERRITSGEGRLTALEAVNANVISAGVERRRIGGITNKALMVFMAVCTFFITSVIAVANFMTQHPS